MIMKVCWSLVSVVLVLLVVSCHAAGVYRITSANIDSVYAQNDMVVLNFCAPWSTLCREIAPAFENASYAEYPLTKVLFGTVDSKTEGKLRTQYNVWSYPHISVRKFDGSLAHYRGRVHAAGIIAFVKRAAFTNYVAIGAPKYIDEFLHFEDVAVVGLFEEAKREYYNFFEIAKRLHPKLLIGFASNASYFHETYNIQLSPAAVVVFKRFENSMTVYKGDFSIQVLANWILENTKLQVNFLQPENAFKYLGFKIPGVLLFLDTLNTNVTSLGQSSLQQAISSGDRISITTIQKYTPSPSTTTTTFINEDGTTIHTSTTETNGDGDGTHTTHTTRTVVQKASSGGQQQAFHSASHTASLNPSSSSHSSSSRTFSHSSSSSSSSSSSTSHSHTTSTNTESSPLGSTTTTTTTQQFYASPTNDVELDAVHAVSEYTIALQNIEPQPVCNGEFLACLAMFHELAPEYKDQLNFIYTDGLSFQPFMNRLGLRNLPSVVIFDWSQEKHYLFDTELPITKSNLRTLFSNFFSNQLSHYIRSARTAVLPSPPISNLVFAEGNSSRIVHVTADQFGDRVLATNTHVLLYIHLPWCGYCKSAWPAYEKLSNLVTDETVTIAEFDASLNDMPRNFPSSSWPTLFPHVMLFRVNQKAHPIALVHELSLGNMAHFLTESIPSIQMDQEELEANVEAEQSFLQQLLQSRK